MAVSEVYQFRDFTLDVGERRLSRAEVPLHLPPKAHDLLVALVRHPGKLLTKDALLALIWPDTFVEESNLTVHVSAVRKALGDDARPSTYVETVSGSGYRFIAPVSRTRSGDQSEVTRNAVRPLEVYEFVGCGRSHFMSASFVELPQALSAFRSAVEIDPTYAPAHAGLALTYCAQARLGYAPHLEAFAQAKTSALRALACDDSCADAQVALGTVLYHSEWDWVGAEKALHRAIEINPTHTEALLLYGSLLEALGKLEQGLGFKQKALEGEPRSALVFLHIGRSYWHQRRYDDTIEWVRKALEVDPHHVLPRELLAAAYLRKGDVVRFLDEVRRRSEIRDAPGGGMAHSPDAIAEMRDAYAEAGPQGLARCVLRHLPKGDYGPLLVRRVSLFGVAGDLDSAFELLDRCIERREPGLTDLAVSPQWDSLRDDPRFNERLARMGLVPAPVQRKP